MKKQIQRTPQSATATNMGSAPHLEMKRPTIFVVINNVSVLTNLYKYLREEFNQRFTILTFKTINETVNHLDKKPDIVVLDNALINENISEFQELIENKNPQVKVLMLSSHKQVGKALNESLKTPTPEVNPKEPRRTFYSMLYAAAVYPINLLTREFKVSKFVAIFILTFITVGIVSLVGYLLVVNK